MGKSGIDQSYYSKQIQEPKSSTIASVVSHQVKGKQTRNDYLTGWYKIFESQDDDRVNRQQVIIVSQLCA